MIHIYTNINTFRFALSKKLSVEKIQWYFLSNSQLNLISENDKCPILGIGDYFLKLKINGVFIQKNFKYPLDLKPSFVFDSTVKNNIPRNTGYNSFDFSKIPESDYSLIADYIRNSDNKSLALYHSNKNVSKDTFCCGSYPYMVNEYKNFLKSKLYEF